MVGQGIGYYVIITMVLLTLLTATNLIPLLGFLRRRWKGLAIGCIIQPILCVILSLLTVFGAYFYQLYEFHKYHEAAMATVKKVDADGNTLSWYIKPDEECLYERRKSGKKSSFLSANNVKLYDVVPLDSFAVCIDDKIVVKFDLENRKATATEYDEPIDVDNVNWDKVSDFFKKHH